MDKERKKVNFYVWASYQDQIGTGYYYLLLEYKGHKKFIEIRDIVSHSNTHLVLLGVLKGIKMLKCPSNITVYSNPLFGVKDIYGKDGLLRGHISSQYNSKEKEELRSLIQLNKHHMDNFFDSSVKQKLMLERDEAYTKMPLK